MIYKNPGGTYGYTEPKGGAGTGLDPSSVSAPEGADVVGDYHTHGDYSIVGPGGEPVRTANPSEDGQDSDNFFSDDIIGITHDAHGNPDYRGYLGTPSGQVKVFNPSGGHMATFRAGKQGMDVELRPGVSKAIGEKVLESALVTFDKAGLDRGAYR